MIKYIKIALFALKIVTWYCNLKNKFVCVYIWASKKYNYKMTSLVSVSEKNHFLLNNILTKDTIDVCSLNFHSETAAWKDRSHGQSLWFSSTWKVHSSADNSYACAFRRDVIIYPANSKRDSVFAWRQRVLLSSPPLFVRLFSHESNGILIYTRNARRDLS